MPPEPEPAEEIRTVRLPADLVKKALIAAKHKGVSVCDLLAPHLVKPVEKAYAEAIQEMHAELGTPAGA